MPDGLKLFCSNVKKRLHNDFDAVIAISGYEGLGKSTLEVLMGQQIDPKFELDNNMAYMPTYKYMSDKFNSLPQFSFFGIDEAIKVLHKYQWMNKLQQAIVRLYATERKQNKCTVLCIPRFKDLNENFRNHRVLVWVHVITRGVAVAYLKDDNEFAKDPWHMAENYIIKQRMLGRKSVSDRTIEDKLRAAKKTMNYWFDFEFPDLDDKTKARYRELSNYYKARYKEEDTTDKSSRIEMQSYWIAKLIDYINKEYHIPIEKISQMIEMSGPTAFTYLRKLKT
jgi:hypothetical protein